MAFDDEPKEPEPVKAVDHDTITRDIGGLLDAEVERMINHVVSVRKVGRRQAAVIVVHELRKVFR